MGHATAPFLVLLSLHLPPAPTYILKARITAESASHTLPFLCPSEETWLGNPSQACSRLLAEFPAKLKGNVERGRGWLRKKVLASMKLYQKRLNGWE